MYPVNGEVFHFWVEFILHIRDKQLQRIIKPSAEVPGDVFFLEERFNQVIYESVRSMQRHNQRVY